MTLDAAKAAMTETFVLGVILGIAAGFMGAVYLAAGVYLKFVRVTPRAESQRGMTFEVSPQTLTLLERLRRLSESKDNAETIGRALAYYSLLLRESADREATVVLRYPGGDESQVPMA